MTSNIGNSSETEPRQMSDLVRSTDSAVGLFASPQARVVARRYGDAYTVANSIVDQGRSVKVIAVVVGIVIGLLVAVVAVIAVGADAAGVMRDVGVRTAGVSVAIFVVLGLGFAVFIASIIYAHGVRIAAEGQHLLAAIDIAVNTSHFITDAERAEIMGLGL